MQFQETRARSRSFARHGGRGKYTRPRGAGYRPRYPERRPVVGSQSTAVNVTQDWVDNAFTYGTKGLPTVDWNLEQTLKNVPSAFTAPQAPGAIAAIDQLMSQLKVIAKAVKATPTLQAALHHSDPILTDALGASPGTP